MQISRLLVRRHKPAENSSRYDSALAIQLA
jgi:hypothetical protein